METLVVVIQLATVEKKLNQFNFTTITTVADVSSFNGNIGRRLLVTGKCNAMLITTDNYILYLLPCGERGGGG